MTFKLSTSSIAKLEHVHPDLVKVVYRALELTPTDFAVTYGLRTPEEQKLLVAAGKSKTMNSRHLTGHAVDLTPYITKDKRFSDGRTVDRPYFINVATAMKESGKELDIPLEWGGDWKEFADLYHFQLPWNAYPLR
jgi:peptidoglycan L-alanyl-D-glutamate endopeptidase CwlK